MLSSSKELNYSCTQCHAWIIPVVILQGAPGPTGLKGNRGDNGPTVRPDNTVCNHITLSFLPHFYIFFYLSCSLSFLIKGPHGLPGPPGINGKSGKRVRYLEYCKSPHWESVYLHLVLKAYCAWCTIKKKQFQLFCVCHRAVQEWMEVVGFQVKQALR